MNLFFYLSKFILEGYNKHKRTLRASFIKSGKDVIFIPTYQKVPKYYLMQQLKHFQKLSYQTFEFE